MVKFQKIQGEPKNDCEDGAGRKLEKSVGKGDRHQKCADAVNAKGLKLFSVDMEGNCHGCNKFKSKSRDKGRKPYKVTKVVMEASSSSDNLKGKPCPA